VSETLVVRRVIRAPAERLFDAWTTPAHLLAWWGPAGVKCVGAEVDLRVGGTYELANALPDGRTLVIRGTFERIERPVLLVYSWQIADEQVSRVTVEFRADGPQTEVIVTHDRIHSRAHRDDHERGWAGCLDGLARWA
jgi:uncharacterized protein YndB with AHSA1/START domain